MNADVDVALPETAVEIRSQASLTLVCVVGAAVADMSVFRLSPALDAGFDQSKQLPGMAGDDELFVRRHDQHVDGAGWR